MLQCGCASWTVTPKLKKQLDGCYTRLLRVTFNIPWRQHLTNSELHDTLSKVSSKIRERRLRFAGHCLRSEGGTVSKVILWTPKHGTRRPWGRPHLTFTDILRQDTDLEGDDIKTAVHDRSVWRTIRIRGKDSS